MLKACTLICRKQGMSVETFQTYWRGTHAEIVKRLPSIERYVQNHPLAGGYRKGDLIYDGLAEIWVNDIDVLRDFATSREYRDVAADEANFIDPQNTALILTDEHVIKDGAGPTDGVKNIELVKRKTGMGVEAFQRYWKETHGPIAAKIPTVRRYVQNHTRKSGYNRKPVPKWDGIAITWFDSVEAMREGAKTEAYLNTRSDGSKFTETATSSFIITTEHVIVS